ncbi:MAG: hypothetical protein U0984_07750 [Prosthecobacter sp.]|nr:hypothetical protein [Prosthecobacter sp.]
MDIFDSFPEARNPHWRRENLYMILDESGKLIPLQMRQEQRAFITARHHRNIVPKARKLGMSTIIVIDYLDACLFNEHTFCAHIDRTKGDAEAKLAIARFAWENGHQHPNERSRELWAEYKKTIRLTTDNAGELAWSHGSMQRAAVSFTGRTPQRLHVSEYGPIAAQEPARAAEIKRGSINSVPKDGTIDIETTMEGGPFGPCYDIFIQGEENAGLESLSPVQWKLHFFPWYNHPSYRLLGRKPEKEKTIEYFASLQRHHHLEIPLECQAWYEQTWATQRENMWSQFPSTPAECIKVPAQGRIYEHIAMLRTDGHVKEFAHERSSPIMTGWDLGVSDFTSGWAVQFAGRDVLWLAWWEGEGKGAADVVSVIRGWEAQFGQRMVMNLFPHDAAYRDKGTARSYREILVDAGLPNPSLHIVPRTPDIWLGINAVRDLLPMSWFHARCDTPRFDDSGSAMPSGVACLEHYRKRPDTSSGILSEVPVHDRTSHTADAARTIAEAWKQGLLGRHLTHGPNAPRRDAFGDLIKPSKQSVARFMGI